MTDPFSSVNATRSALSRLHIGGDPDPEALQLAKANLVCARLDNRIREYTSQTGVRLRDVHVGHLVGLLLSESGVPGDEVERLEAATRRAVAGGAE